MSTIITIMTTQMMQHIILRDFFWYSMPSLARTDGEAMGLWRRRLARPYPHAPERLVAFAHVVPRLLDVRLYVVLRRAGAGTAARAWRERRLGPHRSPPPPPRTIISLWCCTRTARSWNICATSLIDLQGGGSGGGGGGGDTRVKNDGSPTRRKPPGAPDEHLDVARAALRVRIRRLRLLARLLHDGLLEEARRVVLDALRGTRK